MRRMGLIGYVIISGVVLSACGNNAPPTKAPSPSAPTSTAAPSSATPVAEGLPPGIIVATCDTTAGLSLTVSSFQANGQGDTAPNVVIDWAEANETSESTIAKCIALRHWTNGHYNGGVKIRSGFNKDFSAVFVAHRDPSDSSIYISSMGSIHSQTPYKQLSPTVQDEFVKQDDEDPRYHPATDRVYYWDKTQDPPVLMSCRPDATDTKAEVVLGQRFPYSYNEPLYIPNTTALMLKPLNEEAVYNTAGTRGAVVGDSKLVLDAPEKLVNNPVSIDLPESIPYSAFATGLIGDSTVILQDEYQIYRVDVQNGTATATTLLNNDKLKIWDTTPSRDGKTIAFLAEDANGATSLYTVPTNGSKTNGPSKVADFATNSTALLEFTA